MHYIFIDFATNIVYRTSDKRLNNQNQLYCWLTNFIKIRCDVCRELSSSDQFFDQVIHFLDKEIMCASCLLSNSVRPLCQHASCLNSRPIYIYPIYHIINAASSIWSNHYFVKSFPNEQFKETYPMSATVCDNDCLYLLLLFQMMQHHHFHLQY